MDTEPFNAIDLAELGLEELDEVTGGRVDAGPKTMSPQAQQTFAQCSQAFQQGCQAIAQGKQQEQQQTMGLLQQMAQSKGGGGH